MGNLICGSDDSRDPKPEVEEKNKAGKETHGRVPPQKQPHVAPKKGYSYAAAAAAGKTVFSGDEIIVECPHKAVGKVIGKGGSTIKSIEGDTGTNIRVATDTSPAKVFISGGTRLGRNEARERIEEIVYPSSVELFCPKKKVGLLIGKSGSRIRNIQRDTGATVVVAKNSHDNMNRVSITGTRAAVMKARKTIQDIIAPAGNERKLECTSKRAGILIGPRGATIQTLESKHKVHVHVERKKPPAKCVVTVNAKSERAMERACSEIKSIIEPMVGNVDCPADAVGAFIGDDGENIEHLRHQCGDGVSIDVVGDRKKGSSVKIRVEVASSDRKRLDKCMSLVRTEIKEAVASQDYTGEDGRKLRGIANDWAHKMHEAFDAAHAAYEHGDKGRAHRLSSDGKAAKAKMREYNLKASKAIFKHRNDGKPELFIDLHGLTVKEALGFLKDRLEKFLGNDKDDPLECVTGAGHHSPNHTARIKPAVHDLIVKMGLKYEVENIGTFIIHC